MADGNLLNSFAISFMSTLNAAKKATTEEPVQIMWNNILHTAFPTNEPYKIGIKSRQLSTEHEPDGVVIEIRFIQGPLRQYRESNELREYQIFMIECKKPQEDNPGGWENSKDQLLDYLACNLNNCTRMFAATCIGTKVKFYEWNGANSSNPTLTSLHRGQLELQSPAGRIGVEAQLAHVKANGWGLVEGSIP